MRTHIKGIFYKIVGFLLQLYRNLFVFGKVLGVLRAEIEAVRKAFGLRLNVAFHFHFYEAVNTRVNIDAREEDGRGFVFVILAGQLQIQHAIRNVRVDTAERKFIA